MSSALEELKSRLTEIQDDFTFVALAVRLRPRMGEIVNWQQKGEVLELARTFMSSRSSNPEGVYGPLLVRLIAALERYLRMLVIYAVDHHVKHFKKFDDLPQKLNSQNQLLTARMIISTNDSPRDHIVVNTDSLIENLASCKRGNTAFQLNSIAFSVAVTGVTPSIIEKALANVRVEQWWDHVGTSVKLAKLLGTKGTRDTGTRAQDRLKELSRWRNNLAHGGDEQIALTDAGLTEAIDFVSAFCEALDGAVTSQLNKK
jgi:hypothetical protein